MTMTVGRRPGSAAVRPCGRPAPVRFTAYDGQRVRSRGRAVSARPAQTSAGCATWSPHPATSAWRGPTSPATSTSTACTPATRTTALDAAGATDASAVRRPGRGCRRCCARACANRWCRRAAAAAGAPAALAPDRWTGCATPATATPRRSSHHYDVSQPLLRAWSSARRWPTPAPCFPSADADAGGGAGREVRPGRPQARPAAGHAAARRRLRLGRHGAPRRPALRRHARSA